MSDVLIIHNLINRYKRRLRIGAAIRRGLSMLVWGAVAALLLIATAKLLGFKFGFAAFSFFAIPVALAVGCFRGWKRAFCTDYAAVKQLDRQLGFHDRLANAHYFLTLPPERRTRRLRDDRRRGSGAESVLG